MAVASLTCLFAGVRFSFFSSPFSRTPPPPTPALLSPRQENRSPLFAAKVLRRKCMLNYAELPSEQQKPFREKVLMVHLKTYNENSAVRKQLALATADVVLQSLAAEACSWEEPIANLIAVLGESNRYCREYCASRKPYCRTRTSVACSTTSAKLCGLTRFSVLSIRCSQSSS